MWIWIYNHFNHTLVMRLIDAAPLYYSLAARLNYFLLQDNLHVNVSFTSAILWLLVSTLVINIHHLARFCCSHLKPKIIYIFPLTRISILLYGSLLLKPWITILSKIITVGQCIFSQSINISEWIVDCSMIRRITLIPQEFSLQFISWWIQTHDTMIFKHRSIDFFC